MQRDEGAANGSRMAAVLGAAVDQTDDPVVFAKLLVCLSPGGRDTCLKHCKKDDGFLALVLCQAVSIFERAPENVRKLLWRFSVEAILRALGLPGEPEIAIGQT